MTKEAFEVMLSAGEFLWLLAAAGGVETPVHLPLDRMTPSEQKTLQAEGEASLRRRGWLQKGPSGQRLDAFLMAVAYGLLSATDYLRMEHHTRAGFSAFYVFPWGETAMTVAFSAPSEGEISSLQLTVYAHPQEALQAAKERLPDVVAADVLRSSLPLPQPYVLLPLVWKAPAQAAKILATRGWEPLHIEQLLQTLQWYWRFSLESFRQGAGGVLCGCEEGACWGAGDDAEERVSCVPARRAVLEMWLGQQWKKMVEGEEDGVY